MNSYGDQSPLWSAFRRQRDLGTPLAQAGRHNCAFDNEQNDSNITFGNAAGNIDKWGESWSNITRSIQPLKIIYDNWQPNQLHDFQIITVTLQKSDICSIVIQQWWCKRAKEEFGWCHDVSLMLAKVPTVHFTLFLYLRWCICICLFEFVYLSAADCAGVSQKFPRCSLHNAHCPGCKCSLHYLFSSVKFDYCFFAVPLCFNSIRRRVVMEKNKIDNQAKQIKEKQSWSYHNHRFWQVYAAFFQSRCICHCRVSSLLYFVLLATYLPSLCRDCLRWKRVEPGCEFECEANYSQTVFLSPALKGSVFSAFLALQGAPHAIICRQVFQILRMPLFPCFARHSFGRRIFKGFQHFLTRSCESEIYFWKKSLIWFFQNIFFTWTRWVVPCNENQQSDVFERPL